jgi:hypothetical protein
VYTEVANPSNLAGIDCLLDENVGRIMDAGKKDA